MKGVREGLMVDTDEVEDTGKQSLMVGGELRNALFLFFTQFRRDAQL